MDIRKLSISKYGVGLALKSIRLKRFSISCKCVLSIHCNTLKCAITAVETSSLSGRNFVCVNISVMILYTFSYKKLPSWDLSFGI